MSGSRGTVPPPRPRFIEPTRRLPLKWGRYEDRYILGTVLIVSGTLALQASNIYAVVFIAQGFVALTVGWAILPARGWRRFLAATLAGGQAITMLVGPQSLWTLAVPFLLWMAVRHRPLRSYITVLFPVVSGISVAQFFEEYGGMPLALTISMAVFVASAWIARFIAAQGVPKRADSQPEPVA